MLACLRLMCENKTENFEIDLEKIADWKIHWRNDCVLLLCLYIVVLARLRIMSVLAKRRRCARISWFHNLILTNSMNNNSEKNLSTCSDFRFYHDAGVCLFVMVNNCGRKEERFTRKA